MTDITNKYLRKKHFQYNKLFKVYWKKIKANPDSLYLFYVPIKSGGGCVYLVKDTENLEKATTVENWFDELDKHPRKIIWNKLDMENVF